MSISDSQQNSPDPPSCKSTKQSRSTFLSSRHIFPTINRNSLFISDNNQNSPDPPPHLLDISSLQSTETQCQFLPVNKTVQIHLPIFSTYLPTINRNSLFISDNNQNSPDLPPHLLDISSLQSTETQCRFLPVNKTVQIHLPASQQNSPDPPSCQSTKQSRSTFLSSRHIFPTTNRNSLFISDNNQNSPDPPPHLLDISSLQSTETHCQFLPVSKTVQIHLPASQQNSPDPPSCQSTKQSRSTFLSSRHIFPTINRNSLFISDNNQNSPDPTPHLLDISSLQSTEIHCSFLTITKTVRIHLPIFSTYLPYNQQKLNVNFCQSTKQSRSTFLSSRHIFPTINRNSLFISDNNQNSPDPPPHLLDISSPQSTETQCQFLTVNKTVWICLPIFSTYLP